MKKLGFLVLTLVLTAALLTGCGCTSQDAKYTTAPTTMPTVMTTAPTTPTTSATTEATTPTADRGNGPLEDTTMDTTATTGSTEATDSALEGRARQMLPSAR